MPSLFRFLTVVAVIGGLIYGGIFALANFVNPKPRSMPRRKSPGNRPQARSGCFPHPARAAI